MRKSTLLAVSLFILSHFGFAQTKKESLRIKWPEEYKWKLVTNQQTDTAQLIQFIPGNEEATNWTIMTCMNANKGISLAKMEDARTEFFKSARLEAPKAKLTPLDGSNTAKNPWILFKIESESSTHDPNPESQLYYIIQTDTYLYTCFVALKEKQLSAEFVQKWSAVFKSRQLLFTQPSLLPNYQKYVDETDHFSLDFPNSWTYQRQEDSPIKFIALRTKEFPTDIARENINLNFINSPNSNVDQCYATLVKALSTKESKTKILKEGEFMVDTQKVKWLIETSDNQISGERMKDYAFVYYANGKCVVMTCTALVDTFSKHQETFQKIARSFKM